MNTICVIGGANIDICGASNDVLKNYESNPGQISISYGGVGRNIAQICALLGQKVKFVSCFSADQYGTMMMEDCKRLNMDIAYSKVVEGLPSSMYIAILDHDKDMKIGMSDMRLLRQMDEAMLDRALNSLDRNDVVIVDANLDLNSLAYIVRHCKNPISADPVSAHKAKRLAEFLDKITIFKPNQFESKEMTGIEIKDEKSAKESLNWFKAKGVKEIIISMAEKGLLFGYKDVNLWLTHRKIDLANATGGGDSLLGAYTARRMAGYSEIESIKYAISTAVIEIEQDAVRRRSLDPKEIEIRTNEMQIKEKQL